VSIFSFGKRRRNSTNSASPSAISPQSEQSHIEINSELHDLLESRDKIESLIKGLLQSIEARELPSSDVEPEGKEEIERMIKNGDIDNAYRMCLQRFLKSPFITSASGELLTVRIIGKLKDQSIAWYSEDVAACGTLSPSDLDNQNPTTSDRIRLRFVGYPWGCITRAIVPGSLSNAETTNNRINTHSRGVAIPKEVLGTRLATLEAGDIVIARIPYDGYRPFDNKWRTGKRRPAVFRGWENDYALLHPIYDAGGHVAKQGLSHQLVDTHLHKSSVVRKVAFDIAPSNIKKKVGSIGPRDRQTLGLNPIVEKSTAQTPPLLPNVQEPAETTIEYPVAPPDPWKTVIKSLELDDDLPVAVSQQTALKRVLHRLLENEHTLTQLMKDGIPYSAIGQVLAQILKERRLTSIKVPLGQLMPSVLDEISPANGYHFRSTHDKDQLPILTLEKGIGPSVFDATPLNRENYGLATGAAQSTTKFQIPDEYQTPDIVLMDQASTSRILSNHRIDFLQTRNALSGESEIPCYLIGDHGNYEITPLQYAAKLRGWQIANPSQVGREAICSMATSLVREIDASVVTIVSNYADIVAEIENLGIDVQVISEIVW
jgi:hypothetical protein